MTVLSKGIPVKCEILLVFFNCSKVADNNGIARGKTALSKRRPVAANSEARTVCGHLGNVSASRLRVRSRPWTGR